MFKTLIKQYIQPVLLDHGLELVQDENEMLAYSSSSFYCLFTYNEREGLPYFYAGPSASSAVLFDDDILLTIFRCNKKIDRVSTLEFVQSLASFFKNEGENIIRGQEDLRGLMEYQETRSVEYTARIRQSQR